MLRRSAWSSLFLACCAACAEQDATEIASPIIYGEDDRMEAFESTEPSRDLLVTSSAALMLQWQLEIDALGAVQVDSRTLVERGVCADERYADQPSAAFCSATLIDPELILTAGHCIEDLDLEDVRIVLGWRYDSPGALHPIREDDVYAIRSLVVGGVDRDVDYAVLQLDRAVHDRAPIAPRLTPIVRFDLVSMAGYPLGIPLKLVVDATVTRVASRTRFEVAADAMPGNSGSGVLDENGLLAGVFYASPDFGLTPDGACARYTVHAEGLADASSTTASTIIRAGLCSSGFPTMPWCGTTARCGDRYCTEGETVERCAEDCPVCGDGVCGPLEQCASDCARDSGPPDAGSSPRASTGCGCRVPAREHDASPTSIALALVAVYIWRRRASRGVARARHGG